MSHRTRLHPRSRSLVACLALVLLTGGPTLAQQNGPNLALDLDNVRILLYRTYLPKDGFDSIPLPSISLVIDGVELDLPFCPAAQGQQLRNFVRTEREFARDDATPSRILHHMSSEAGVPFPGRGGLPFCAWWFPVDVDTLNIAFPDSAAIYWVAPFLVDFQQEVVIRGTFFDARYISFALYDGRFDPYFYTPGPGEDPIPSFLADYQIEPDPGSSNPWQTPAAPGGTYTVRIKHDPMPGESNVLPFPEDPNLQFGGGSLPLPIPCTREKAADFPCVIRDMFVSPPQKDQASVFSNPDNTYLPALISLDRSDRVLVVRAKLPRTTPGRMALPWPDAAADIRYWSLCNAVYARPYPSIVQDGCLADLDVVLAADGFAYFVISTADARPRNATAANGVNWLRGRADVDHLLIVRNMLGRDFPNATQNVPKDGSWISAFEVMSEFYPTITIECTTRRFEERGIEGCFAVPGNLDAQAGIPGAGGS